jgi:hypothetical protein
MTVIQRIEPSIPVLTPKGPANAHFLLDYTEDHHLFWVCAIRETGEFWTFPNHEIRAQANPTLGRENIPVPENWWVK